MKDRTGSKAGETAQRLAAWYGEAARDLPWRRSSDPYAIWVSEVMLQQTRVQTVLHYWPRFLDAFPTVQTLAEADEEELLKLWEGLGYYRRARNLQRAAKTVVEQLGGRLPTRASEWRELPGVGAYTSAAIASIAGGEAVAVLDGNVKRLLARLHLVEEEIERPEVERELLGRAEAIVRAGAAAAPPLHPGILNQALMELGATVCTPSSPRCGECPLEDLCGARAEGRSEELPRRRAKRAVPHRVSHAAIVRGRGGGLLIVKRPGEGLLAGLWEFPQVEVKDPSSDTSSLLDHLARCFAVRGEAGPPVATAKHAYSHFTLSVIAHPVHLEEAEAEKLERTLQESSCGPAAFLTPESRSRHALHRAHLKLLERLDAEQGGLFR